MTMSMSKSMVDEAMIQAEGLTKRYGSTQALAGVDFAVPAGTILGLLGPNGAGKTTAVRILTTMALPDSGRGLVAGIDVVKHPGEVRRHIGVAAQDATLDPLLTGRQNLVLVGELSDLGRSESRARAKELLAQFELTDAADRVLKGYSGGMRRRLDLAASLMTRPPVLFLDEPTTGLDPVSRQRVWDAVRDLLDEGVTVLLTTQYLDEADALAHRIVVVDHGRVIADGTPLELKEASRSAHLAVTLAAPHPGAVGAIAPLVVGTVDVSDDGRQLSAGVDASAGLATAIVRALDAAGVLVDNIEVRQPSLDDVFFTLTGGHIEEGPVGDGEVGGDGVGDGDAVGDDGARADGKTAQGRSGRGSRRSGGDAEGGGGGGVGGDRDTELEGVRA
jgi:ABC-2 type transport system ATP-binding protein